MAVDRKTNHGQRPHPGVSERTAAGKQTRPRRLGLLPGNWRGFVLVVRLVAGFSGRAEGWPMAVRGSLLADRSGAPTDLAPDCRGELRSALWLPWRLWAAPVCCFVLYGLAWPWALAASTARQVVESTSSIISADSDRSLQRLVGARSAADRTVDRGDAPGHGGSGAGQSPPGPPDALERGRGRPFPSRPFLPYALACWCCWTRRGRVIQPAWCDGAIGPKTMSPAR